MARKEGHKCLVCGGKMAKTDRSFEPWECVKCHARASETSWGDLAFGEEYLDDEPENTDAGCRACGNPAYPKCKTSCPLFDD